MSIDAVKVKLQVRTPVYLHEPFSLYLNALESTFIFVKVRLCVCSF